MFLVGTTFAVRGGSDMVTKVLDLLEEEGIAARSNPDVYVREYRRLGIDEARELRSRASLRALGKQRVFVIAAADISQQAQNALLKTLEESPGGALFFFVVPSPETLLPTLRSRLQVLSLFANSNELANRETGSIVGIEQFLSAQAPKRLDLLQPLLEKGRDDRRDLGAILRFLSALEGKLSSYPHGPRAARREGLEAVYRARKYITDNGALAKPLLEQVALLVP